MSSSNPYVTYFSPAPIQEQLPKRFPSPFAITPHPLAEQAGLLLQQQLNDNTMFERDFFVAGKGKMFGVLVIKDKQQNLGFLSAFSGMMNGVWLYDGFVPPIFNLEEQAEFLPAGKAKLKALTQQLQDLETSPSHEKLQAKIALLKTQFDLAFKTLKQKHKAAKAARKQQRASIQNLEEPEQQTVMRSLALQSQHHKREAANLKNIWNEQIDAYQHELDTLEAQIDTLKNKRAEISRKLHQRVFDAYKLHNFKGEQQTISHFFEGGSPPAGAGDCAGPKLIHFAKEHHLTPVALAEFWWGAPHPADIRHHGQCYPACRGKCRPILPFMLSGLDVEPEPQYGLDIAADEPHIVFEDEVLLVINKPSGLMSTPGKTVEDSAFSRLLKRYPDCLELRLVHRLDMDTSGLLLVAKNLRIHKLLQKQFIQRTVEKRYEALLSKVLAEGIDQGKIDLPLRVDFYDRPRQMVCYEYGKSALTHWEIIQREDDTTRVYFYPHTGRSHQLRMHAAHHDGLNAAIVGDDLYGKENKRLMLHAQRLCFDHPVTKERLCFEVPAPF